MRLSWNKFAFECADCRFRSEITSRIVETVFQCPACDKVISTQTIPYRLDPVPCPNCKAPLRYKTQINTGALKKNAGLLICPQCKNQKLRLATVTHLVGEEITGDSLQQNEVPRLGQIVHAFYDSTTWAIGHVQLAGDELTKARLTEDGTIPPLEPHTPIECEVLGTLDSKVMLRYLRTLSLDF